MPQIAQQDYKVIAPKPGRGLDIDAAALAELKKSVLNKIAFDCLLKNVHIADDGTLDRIIGIYENGDIVSTHDTSNQEILYIQLPYTVTQYQGLAAVQNGIDEFESEVFDFIPSMSVEEGYLFENESGHYICVDGKYLIVTGSETIEALALAETGPNEFINISWEDAQKLIGLPLV